MSRVNESNITTQHDLEGLPRHLALTVAVPTYQMRVSDTILIVDSAAADAAGIVTLPSLAEAVGKFYFISAPSGATNGDVSLFEKETGALIVTSIAGPFDTDGDHVLIFSTGISWIVVLAGVAA